MSDLRNVYADKAISQIPRLLSLEDRNPYAETYGCFNREYWLCKTTDFPSAIAQFGVHSLALVYANPFVANPYYRSDKVLEWTLAGIRYWLKIQKGDGSFDEFYPNERGWAGPTGFLLYGMMDTYQMMKQVFPDELKQKFFDAALAAGRFLARTDEPGVLANHWAMALLAIHEAYRVLRSKELLVGLKQHVETFLTFCSPEGWCLEYDGADLGYLSATVSFLAKMLKHYRDERLEEVVRRAVEFSSYFVYPNLHYAGTVGSRQTLHFYPHGYEIVGQTDSLSQAVAQKCLTGLARGTLVPPEIQGDRYFLYRIPEFLQAYLDYAPRRDALPKLPFEQAPFRKYFQHAGMYVENSGRNYLVLNLAKGGVTKLFNTADGSLIFNDCGQLGRLEDGTIITTQWIESDRHVAVGSRISVTGAFHVVPQTFFDPLKMMVFRTSMLLLGWQAELAYHIKGLIRRILMLKAKQVPIRYSRTIHLQPEHLLITDRIIKQDSLKFSHFQSGNEFTVRYVPQSNYFQPQELDVAGYQLNPEELRLLNSNPIVTITKQVSLKDGQFTARVSA